MRTPLRLNAGTGLLLALAAACADQQGPAEPAAASRSVAAAALPDPLFRREWGFQGSPVNESTPMYDVFAVAPGEVWAVGEAGLVRRFSGGAFQAGPHVPGNVSTNRILLRGVWGTSASNVLAVGVRVTSTGSAGRVFHYDGSGWTETAVTAADLHEVWGVSPTVAYAVGSEIIRWSGTGSTRVYGPGGTTFYGVWASGPSDVFAVGSGGTIVHYDGAGWTVQPTPTSSTLNGVWGFGPDDVYAVGDGGTILHYDGTSWTAQAGTGAHTLTEVWGPHPDTVLVVGYRTKDRQSVLARLDGSAWTVDTGFGAATSDRNGLGMITSVTGFSADDYFLGTQDPPTAPFYRVVGGADRRLAIQSAWGFGNGTVFAVGDSGLVLRRTEGRWRRLASGTPATLAAVWGPSASELYVGGYDRHLQMAVILRYDGGAFHSVPLPVSRAWISTIWGSRDTVWAATDRPGEILYRSGRTAPWALVPTLAQMQAPLTDLHGVSPRNVFATDTDGKVWRYDGQKWSGTADLRVADGTARVWHDGQAVWVATYPALHRRGTNGGWYQVAPLLYERRVDVVGTGPDDVFVAVGSGVLLRWNGSSLRSLPVPARGVWTTGARPGEVWAFAGTSIHHGVR